MEKSAKQMVLEYFRSNPLQFKSKLKADSFCRKYVHVNYNGDNIMKIKYDDFYNCYIKIKRE